jgi:hypothetical protein
MKPATNKPKPSKPGSPGQPTANPVTPTTSSPTHSADSPPAQPQTTSSPSPPEPRKTAEERHDLIVQTLDLIRNGKTFAEASEQLGVPRSTLNLWLLTSVPEKYREAQEAGVIGKLTKAGESIEDACSHLEVTRARETARFWQWVAERRLPSFAQKSEISGPGGGPIQLEAVPPLELARRVAFLHELVTRRNGEPIDVESSPVPPTSLAST